jgi:hypothetical protein
LKIAATTIGACQQLQCSSFPIPLHPHPPLFEEKKKSIKKRESPHNHLQVDPVGHRVQLGDRELVAALRGAAPHTRLEIANIYDRGIKINDRGQKRKKREAVIYHPLQGTHERDENGRTTESKPHSVH